MPHEGTLINSPEKKKKNRRYQEGTAIYRDSLSKDQVLGTHDIFVTFLHCGLILNLSALLARDSLQWLIVESIMEELPVL